MKSKSLFTKLVAFMLCVIMAISCLPVSAFAADITLDENEGEIDVYETEPPAPGSSPENPATIEWEWDADYIIATATVTVPAKTTMYFADNYIVEGQVLTANGEKVTVTYGSRIWRTPSTFTLTAGEEDVEYNLILTFAEGSFENPANAILGNNTAEIAAGSQGYIFMYNVEEDGYLAVTVSSASGWTATVNNMTQGKYGDTRYSDDDPVVNPTKIAVSAGDDIQIIVNTYDPVNPWAAPAGEVNVNIAYYTPAAPTVELKLSGCSLTLESSLRANFVLEKARYNYYEDVYVEIVRVDAKDGPQEPVIIRETTNNANGNYLYSMSGIAPRMMNDDLQVTIYGTYDGKQYSKTITYQLTIYCYSTLKKSMDPSNAQYDPALATLIVDLLNYATKHQEYMEYNLEKPVNGQLTEAQKNVASTHELAPVDIQNGKYEQIDNPLVAMKGVTLTLSDSILITVPFACDDISGVRGKIVIGDEEFYSDDITWDEAKQRWVINFNQLELFKCMKKF